MIDGIFDNIANISAIWVLGITLLQMTMIVSAVVEMRRLRQRDRHQVWRRVLRSPLVPRVSVLVPAYNEEITIDGDQPARIELSQSRDRRRQRRIPG